MDFTAMNCPNELFLIICDDYRGAQDCFDMFISWLEQNCSWNIMFADPFSNMVRTTDHFTYIFFDHHMVGFYKDYWECFISMDEFFEGMFDG